MTTAIFSRKLLALAQVGCGLKGCFFDGVRRKYFSPVGGSHKFKKSSLFFGRLGGVLSHLKKAYSGEWNCSV